MGIDFVLSPPPWLCKKCNIENRGVICEGCKAWYRPSDSNCKLLK